MCRRVLGVAAVATLMQTTPPRAQDPPVMPPADSILVEGKLLNNADQILAVAGLSKGAVITWRAIQRAITPPLRSGQ